VGLGSPIPNSRYCFSPMTQAIGMCQFVVICPLGS
jgi:hypothetical protein